jgi:hypothetical protein
MCGGSQLSSQLLGKQKLGGQRFQASQGKMSTNQPINPSQPIKLATVVFDCHPAMREA